MPEITIPFADGGRFSAYLSLPVQASGRRPGILFMQPSSRQE
jgi:hypothetical protein